MSADPSAPLTVMTDPCLMGWAGCSDSYTGGHYCDKKAQHEGDHVCVCKARKRNG